MPRFLKQPLLHFMLLGAALFAWNALVNKPATDDANSDSNVIVVDRKAILDYLQYQARAFDAATFSEQWDAMGEQEQQRIIDDYVREEALYREALAMQMEKGDYIIKQRLVQKVEFLLENLVAQAEEPDETTLLNFFNERQQDYAIDAVYSFTHIFFDAEQGGMSVALERATAQLANSAAITFNDAGQHGDRFPFLQNYVERTRDFVSNNFSNDFVEALDKLEPSDSQWQGPIASRYGYHLVLMTDRASAKLPTLDDVRERVLDDYRYEKLVSGRRDAEQKVIDSYRVQIEAGEGQ